MGVDFLLKLNFFRVFVSIYRGIFRSQKLKVRHFVRSHLQFPQTKVPLERCHLARHVISNAFRPLFTDIHLIYMFQCFNWRWFIFFEPVTLTNFETAVTTFTIRGIFLTDVLCVSMYVALKIVIFLSHICQWPLKTRHCSFWPYLEFHLLLIHLVSVLGYSNFGAASSWLLYINVHLYWH